MQHRLLCGLYGPSRRLVPLMVRRGSLRCSASLRDISASSWPQTTFDSSISVSRTRPVDRRLYAGSTGRRRGGGAAFSSVDGEEHRRETDIRIRPTFARASHRRLGYDHPDANYDGRRPSPQSSPPTIRRRRLRRTTPRQPDSATVVSERLLEIH